MQEQDVPAAGVVHGASVSVGRPRFAFLDGMRGLAALAIALFHTWLSVGLTGQTSSSYPVPARFIERFNFAVPVFIVLSGFVLMLPVARSQGLALPGGVISYIIRRARRILPPYYAALLLVLLMSKLIPLMSSRQGTKWDDKLPVSGGAIISHLLLVHNMQGQWAYKIDGPLWSVATEWQIYFAMPLLILPIWRRWGLLRTVLLVIAAGFGTYLLLPSNFANAHLWYVGLFAMGMAAAQLVTSGHLPGWTPILAATFIALTIIGLAIPSVYRHEWLLEPIAGLATACAVASLARKELSARTSHMRKLLESRFLRWVGLWSFSIYLVHSPMLALGNLLTLGFTMPLLMRVSMMFIIVLPMALAVCYVFHRLVERRFQTGHQKLVRA